MTDREAQLYAVMKRDADHAAKVARALAAPIYVEPLLPPDPFGWQHHRSDYYAPSDGCGYYNSFADLGNEFPEPPPSLHDIMVALGVLNYDGRRGRRTQAGLTTDARHA